MKNTATRIVGSATILVALSLTAAACGGDDSARVDVNGAWARTSPMSVEAGAAYFQISSDIDDALIGASIDASVAGEAQIHETQVMEMEDETGEDAMEDDEMDTGDVMQMVEVGRIELPASETISLEPGGFHIMMLDLVEPLENGDTFDITLDFETAEDQVVTVTVGDSAPQ